MKFKLILPRQRRHSLSADVRHCRAAFVLPLPQKVDQGPFRPAAPRQRQLAPGNLHHHWNVVLGAISRCRSLSAAENAGSAISVRTSARYVGRVKDVQKIVRTHDLVTLPDRGGVRATTRLIGNTGEAGEFVLPLKLPASNGNAQQYDHFTFAAAFFDH